jgi:hypothetical protein
LLRGLALGRKSWLFAGLERGAERAALMYTLIQTAKATRLTRRPGSPTSPPPSPTLHKPGSPSCHRGSGPLRSYKRRRNRGLRRRGTAKGHQPRTLWGCPPPSDVIGGRHNDFALPKTFHCGDRRGGKRTDGSGDALREVRAMVERHRPSRSRCNDLAILEDARAKRE